MNQHVIIDDLDKNNRATSNYAEIYYENVYCKTYKPEENLKLKKSGFKGFSKRQNEDEWISPSDLLIGTLDLKPPFTSKIIRGKTHEGLLAIGNSVLENERQRLYKSLKSILNDNDASWECILRNEKQAINKKVKIIYANIFKQKRDTMMKEISVFYENSLKEMEANLKSEVSRVLESSYANIVTDLNIEIKEKLKDERWALELKLRKKYLSEIKKIKEYYELLMNNELHRYNQLKDYVFQQRNFALKAYCKQMEAERLTSVMYVLSLERKKCKIKKMLLEQYQSVEVLEKIQEIKEKNTLLNVFNEKEINISRLNEQWKTKIRKILQLFLKFISFSLKLLPEQTTFLLDLEKMVILQLNEIQKNPDTKSTTLKDENEQTNIFQFKEPELKSPVCNKEPFILVGDLSIPEPPKYGSRETLPSDVDLPYFRVQRQYVYAKCHGYEEIKEMLDAAVCKCRQLPHVSILNTPEIENPKSEFPITATASVDIKSSDEKMVIDDSRYYRECPIRKCNNCIQRDSFPFLDSYLDFSEENYIRVKTLLTDVPKQKYVVPELVNPKDIAYSKLPFSATKEFTRTVETQYSSQENLGVCQISCPCINDMFQSKQEETTSMEKFQSEQNLNEILAKRKASLNQMLVEHPKLLQIFTDEEYDFKM